MHIESGRDPGVALTTRERDVLALVATWRTIPEIARVLDLSEHTVRHHIERAMGKLGVQTRREAVRIYLESVQADAERGDERSL